MAAPSWLVELVWVLKGSLLCEKGSLLCEKGDACVFESLSLRAFVCQRRRMRSKNLISKRALWKIHFFYNSVKKISLIYIFVRIFLCFEVCHKNVVWCPQGFKPKRCLQQKILGKSSSQCCSTYNKNFVDARWPSQPSTQDDPTHSIARSLKHIWRRQRLGILIWHLILAWVGCNWV